MMIKLTLYNNFVIKIQSKIENQIISFLFSCECSFNFDLEFLEGILFMLTYPTFWLHPAGKGMKKAGWTPVKRGEWNKIL